MREVHYTLHTSHHTPYTIHTEIECHISLKVEVIYPKHTASTMKVGIY